MAYKFQNFILNTHIERIISKLHRKTYLYAMKSYLVEIQFINVTLRIKLPHGMETLLPYAAYQMLDTVET